MIKDLMIGIKGEMIKSRNALRAGKSYKVRNDDHTEVWRCAEVHEHGALFVTDQGVRHFLHYYDICLKVS